MFPICRPGDLPPHIVHGVGYQKVMLLYDRWILSFPIFLYNGFPLTFVPVYSFFLWFCCGIYFFFAYLIPNSQKSWESSIKIRWYVCFIQCKLFAASWLNNEVRIVHILGHRFWGTYFGSREGNGGNKVWKVIKKSPGFKLCHFQETLAII